MGLEGGGGALRHRGAGELLRGLLVLRLCACPPLVRHADTVLRASRRALPRPLWAALLRASFYGHFALGAGPAQVERAVRRMRELRLRPLLALPIEAAAPEEAELERNLEAALRCADMAAATAEPAAGAAMMQLKVTALMSARLCETLSRRLAEPGAGLSPERLADVMGGEAPSFPCLTRAENAELGGALRRLDAVAQRAGRCHVRLLLDAEQQPLNAALALAGAALAERHNRELPLVWGTCQAYAQPSREDTDRRMAELGLPRSGPVSFGQLLGMSDSLSLALGAAGYSAYKSAPLGDPEAVLPYLARRAREHGALLGGTGAERLRLRREIRDRLRRRLRML
ncbi:hydroxyproline dehydrogenase [Eudromia elegans]